MPGQRQIDFKQAQSTQEQKEKIPEVAAMFQDQRQEPQGRPQHQRQPKEVFPVLPCCASVEGGKAFRDIAEESEGQNENQITRTSQQLQHHPQRASPPRVLPHPYQEYTKKSEEGSYWII